MATPLKIISAALVDTGAVLTLDLNQSINVEAFDMIDLAITLHYDGTNKPTSIKFYTSPEKTVDDMSKTTTKWLQVGSLLAANISGSKVYRLTLPDTTLTGSFLSRWLRWEITASTNGCMVDVDGMGRRKCT